MKTLKNTVLIVLFCLLGTQVCEAQFLKKLGKKAEEAAERAVIKKTEQKVTKETEKAMDSILNPKTGKMEKKGKNKKRSKSDKNPSDTSTNENSEQNEVEEVKETPKAWSKYNFVPGDEILFEDNLHGEENGEFPSRWDLTQGNAENASLGENNIIRFENRSIITPLMETEEYLPEVFTIEFDAYFEDVYASWQNYQVRFWNSTQYLSLPNKEVYWPINLQSDGANTQVRYNGTDKRLRGHDKSTMGSLPGWKHIAISFNKRTLKVFVDEYRALNIPNYKHKPKMFSIGTYLNNPEGKIMAIKNIRIAKGGKKLYDRVMADGKFVTRGILFDVNKATIKPESFGVLNEVAKMMKEHNNLKFRIEGHTDSDGADDYNLKLSAERAAAVKNALTELGISKDRLQTEGKGESTPVSENKTAEGKANNRRVEFIKI